MLSRDIDFYNVHPIAWITKSQILLDYLSSADSDFLVADFASGEYDRIPSFFVTMLPNMGSFGPKRLVVYCTDIHALRLDSLLGKLEESKLLNDVRVVQAKLETMDDVASFRPDMVEYLVRHPATMTTLDHHLIDMKFIPDNIFDIGVLNNDVVGYLHEYYKEYSDAVAGLKKVCKSLKEDALLIVTMPCSLYPVDNIGVLESLGFEFLEGKDVDLAGGTVNDLKRDTKPQEMSRLGHYTFLIFVRK
ncbi:MAG: hypothetical protein ACFFE2_15475 [Candidatus Thorarchaeota archaeon]